MAKALAYPDYYAHSLQYAHRSNYSGPRSARAQYVAIHTVQGSYSSCVNWFKNPAANVSAHYVVSSSGRTVQMVGENMMAWHIGQHNNYTIGIEHEGYAHDGHPPTQAMYHASAKLTAGICRRHNIPVSRVLGHRDFRNQTHTDPGNEWRMAYYRKLVAGYMRKGTPASPARPSSPPKKKPESDTNEIPLKRINICYAGPRDEQTAEAYRVAINSVARERGMSESFARSVSGGPNIRFAAQAAWNDTNDYLQTVVLGRPAIKELPKYMRDALEKDSASGSLIAADGDGWESTNTIGSWRLLATCEWLGFGRTEKDRALAHYKEKVPLKKV